VISYHIGVFCCFRGVRCCHHKLVRTSSLMGKWKPAMRSHTRAVSHASATYLNRMGRARPAASGEGSSDHRRRKRKMDITPYRFTCVCSCANGASLSLLSPLPFPAAIRVIAPRRNETFVTCMQIIQFELDTPPTPLRALMLNLFSPHPLFPDTNVPSSSLEFFYGLCYLRVARANVSPIVPVMYY